MEPLGLQPPPRPARARAADLAALGLAAFLPLASVLAGARGPVAFGVNLGPNDGRYLSGFVPLYEIDPGDQVATRWSTRQAAVVMPLVVRGGPVEVAYRFARVLPETAVVETRLAGRTVDRFSCRGGVFLVRRVRLGALPPTPVAVAFDVDSHDSRGLGLRMDWVRLAVGNGGSVFLSGAARWRAVAVGVAAVLLFRAAGFATWPALLLALPFSGGTAVWAAVDPLGLAHVTAKAGLPALLLSSGVALVLRGRPGGRWATVAFAAGYTLKACAVFHPSTFYPDVMNHRRYVTALVEAQGSLPQRGIAAQVAVKTAYPRIVAGRPYAFPYSPLFFVPFTWLPRDTELVEDAMRHVAVAAAAAEVPVVFGMGAAAFGPGAGVAAAWVAATLPPLHSRLLLAVWPTIVGHLLDLLAIAAALRLSLRPESLHAFLALAAATGAAFLTYISSLFNLTALLAALALIERRLRVRLLAMLAAGAMATVLLLYLPFVRDLLTEILPALASAAGGNAAAPAASEASGGLLAAISRVPMFFGYGFPALAIAGLALARRRSAAAFKLLAAWGAAFLLLLLLRGLGGGLFKDLKEVTFVAPWIGITSGLTLSALWDSGPRGRSAVLFLAVGLAGFAVERYWGYLQAYASPVTRF